MPVYSKCSLLLWQKFCIYICPLSRVPHYAHLSFIHCQQVKNINFALELSMKTQRGSRVKALLLL